jgi:hypothetical protein
MSEPKVIPLKGKAVLRCFVLNRHEDVTEVSGTGIVAFGVEWVEGGKVSLYWPQEQTTGQYASIEQVKRIHCHHGATDLLFYDEQGWRPGWRPGMTTIPKVEQC